MKIEPFDTYSEEEMCVLYTLTQISNQKSIILKFVKENIIKFDSKTKKYYIVDEKLKAYFNSVSVETISDEEKIVTQLMSLFPSGMKQGTNKSWRGNKMENIRKLKKLKCLTKQELNYDDVITATEKYVNSFNGDFQFMRTLPYFILKRIIIDGNFEYNSDLLSVIESLKSSDSSPITPNQDWITQLK